MALVESNLDGRGVLTVTLNDVPRRNALSRDLLVELVDVLDDADHSSDVRVVVLTNSGSVFCAGANLGEQSSPQGGRTVEMAEVFGRFARSPKPYVGRIAGHCVAGGMGLAAAMDISVGLVDAKFGFTEARLGLIPATISPYCLARMGEAMARRVFMSARLFGAQEAVTLGLLARAVSAGDLDAAVEAEVTPYLSCAPGAVAASKRLARFMGPRIDRDVIDHSIRALAAQWETEEAREGVRAFFAKEKAPWIAR